MSRPLTDPQSAKSAEVGPAAGPAPTSGHQQNIAELAREHNRALHAFLMARLRDEHEAHDVAQEAYARLLQLDRPGTVSFLRAYLFRTAANIAIDRARQRIQRSDVHQREFAQEPVDRLSPEVRTLSAEDLAVLKQALLELSSKARRVFLLYRLEGWSDARIATRLGIGTRMVRYYITQAGIYCRLRVQGLPQEAAREQARFNATERRT